jgi:hypothetical protein
MEKGETFCGILRRGHLKRIVQRDGTPFATTY